MHLFRGTSTNKIDSKGRVSVPARFRAVIEADGLNGICCNPVLNRPVLEAGGERLVREIDGMLSRLPPYSEAREALAHTLIGASEDLAFDGQGRVLLPDSFRSHANLTDSVTFAGLGNLFQMWDPKAYQAYLIEARQRAFEHRALLRPSAPVGMAE